MLFQTIDKVSLLVCLFLSIEFSFVFLLLHFLRWKLKFRAFFLHKEWLLKTIMEWLFYQEILAPNVFDQLTTTGLQEGSIIDVCISFK